MDQNPYESPRGELLPKQELSAFWRLTLVALAVALPIPLAIVGFAFGMFGTGFFAIAMWGPEMDTLAVSEVASVLGGIVGLSAGVAAVIIPLRVLKSRAKCAALKQPRDQRLHSN
jgi:hypothetical protein